MGCLIVHMYMYMNIYNLLFSITSPKLVAHNYCNAQVLDRNKVCVDTHMHRVIFMTLGIHICSLCASSSLNPTMRYVCVKEGTEISKQTSDTVQKAGYIKGD